ncbi:hypothetical protein EV421DRAFT_1389650 [Armillaria borealis]|uniref:Uncharacterized protein n=1 Tax=Armillaria borealis TaxID=47425 RepID=A0AA39MHH5_9AGAR|nr:hypothetical protein EV421DRAFT_1389650 [Armillaria borealis]
MLKRIQIGPARIFRQTLSFGSGPFYLICFLQIPHIRAAWMACPRCVHADQSCAKDFRQFWSWAVVLPAKRTRNVHSRGHRGAYYAIGYPIAVLRCSTRLSDNLCFRKVERLHSTMITDNNSPGQ